MSCFLKVICFNKNIESIPFSRSQNGKCKFLACKQNQVYNKTVTIVTTIMVNGLIKISVLFVWKRIRRFCVFSANMVTFLCTEMPRMSWVAEFGNRGLAILAFARFKLDFTRSLRCNGSCANIMIIINKNNEMIMNAELYSVPVELMACSLCFLALIISQSQCHCLAINAVQCSCFSHFS